MRTYMELANRTMWSMFMHKAKIVIAAAAGPVIVAGWLSVCAASGWAEESAVTAKAIEAASGIRVGLCVHLDCGREGSDGLTAALAAGSERLLVYGLALNDAARLRTAKGIESAGLNGRASVERLDGASLPCLDNLANLIVLENPADLTAAGVTRDEMMRVLAPGGVLCVREKNSWSRTVKPRPGEMDEWPHPNHGADGNRVSSDGLVKFPTGIHWIDGLPFNLHSWADCRAWVVAGGRCFSYGAAEFENMRPVRGDAYLAARDAFNGLPLWKINCGPSAAGFGSLNWRNAGPLVTDGERVYAVCSNKLVIVAAATGSILAQCNTEFVPARVLLADGMLLAGSWDGVATSVEKKGSPNFEGSSLWPTFYPKTDKGSVEAFDPVTGQRKWGLPIPAYQLLAADGKAYAMINASNPPTAREIVAINIKDGKELWRVPHTQFGTEPDLQLNVAGPGCLVVAKGNKDRAVFVLAADTGRERWKIQPAKEVWTPVVEGLLWNDDKRYDLLSGEVKGNWAFGLGPQNNVLKCQPSFLVGKRYSMNGAWGVELPPENAVGAKTKKVSIGAARPACLEGVTPANGMFYMAQNHCICVRNQILGFRAFAPAEPPTAADFAKARPVEKGPAFGSIDGAATSSASDWPSFRHDAQRSSCTTGEAPDGIAEIWRVQVGVPDQGPLGKSWQSRLAPCVSVPVVVQGLVYVTVPDEGRITAFRTDNGKVAWTIRLNARVDVPPTVHGGLCLIGSCDGWLYALRAKDGVMAWRTRIAPLERRMVAHGQIESVWPIVGPVLVKDDTAFVTAGRSVGADGGVALVALNARSGETRWARAVSEGEIRNDLLVLRGALVGFGAQRFDPATGASVKSPDAGFPLNLENWRSEIGRGFAALWLHPLSAPAFLAWNDNQLITPKFAVSMQRLAKPAPFKTEELSWQITWPWGVQVEATAMGAGKVVYGGRVNSIQGNDPTKPIGDPAVHKDAKVKATGFVKAVSSGDGKPAGEIALESPVICDGVAIAEGRVFVTLRNGALVCLGGPKGH
ncbi:MAG: hypothetical protein C0404_08440 [Verrucomicrobia bacterium]|nr:hypothetical protein [Verrucomicrobiota bacterium]